MNDESTAWIDDALGALAATDGGLGPPTACVGTAVLREWDQQQARQSRRRPVRRSVRLGTGAGRGRRVLRRCVDTTRAIGHFRACRGACRAGGFCRSCARSATRVSDEDGVATPSARPATVPYRPRPVADANVIVPDPLVDPTTLRVVRVRMSRMALATLGMPLVNPDADSLVEVEILVGDEGVAQSIRRAVLVSEPAKD